MTTEEQRYNYIDLYNNIIKATKTVDDIYSETTEGYPIFNKLNAASQWLHLLMCAHYGEEEVDTFRHLLIKDPIVNTVYFIASERNEILNKLERLLALLAYNALKLKVKGSKQKMMRSRVYELCVEAAFIVNGDIEED